MDLQAYVMKHQIRINSVLDKCLPNTEVEPKILHQAMRYSVLNGGKRIRAIFTYAVGEALGAKPSILDKVCAAIEIIHAFSLIHDDLPALDNDDLRRGKPACHRVYGEGIAILAGDALLTLAFEILATLYQQGLNAEVQAKIMKVLTHAIGSQGMAGGEVLDIVYTNKEITLKQLKTIYILKTSDLFGASVLMGALAAHCENKITLKNLKKFAYYLGLAFQIHDDIIDIEADSALSGKPQGSDILKNKPTFPALIGLDMAKRKEKQAFGKALAYLKKSSVNNNILMDLSNFVITRKY